MRVVALQRLEYGTPMKLYEPGDEFDTDNDEHADLLQKAGRVKIVPHVMTTRDMNAEGKRNRYKHRQLKADE